jgi:hypothetical protein
LNHCRSASISEISETGVSQIVAASRVIMSNKGSDGVSSTP